MGQIISDVTDIVNSKKDKKSAETARQKILEQMKADQAAKNNLIKKNLAAQRAKFGGSGMNAAGLTEGAVLKRIREETEQPFKDKERANKEKLSSIKHKKPNLLKGLLKDLDKVFS